MLSMGQAATEAGVSKSTLSRAIHSGRLSAARTEAGGFQIDPAELFRVYPRNGAGSGSTAHRATGSDASGEAAAIKAENEGLRAQLAMLRELADEMKAQRDGWQKQAEASQRLLADQRHQPNSSGNTIIMPDQRPARRGWFGWRKAG